jgi:septal ring factor EnvC (AmiA/AmiB activator)
MFKSTEIAALQGQVTKLEGELKTATEGHARIEAELATANASLQTAQTKHATAEATILDLQGKVTAAETAKTTAETQAAAAVASVDANKRDPSAKVGVDGQPKIDASAPPMQRAAAAMSTWSIFGKN